MWIWRMQQGERMINNRFVDCYRKLNWYPIKVVIDGYALSQSKTDNNLQLFQIILINVTWSDYTDCIPCHTVFVICQ